MRARDTGAVRRVAVESPVYAYAKLLFESLGHELVGVHLDPFAGLDLDAWGRALATRATPPASPRSTS